MKIAATHIALIIMKPEAYLFFSSSRPCLIGKVKHCPLLPRDEISRCKTRIGIETILARITRMDFFASRYILIFSKKAVSFSIFLEII